MATATPAARDPSATGYNITRDPNLVMNRIYLGNLPSCTREELESICHPYGKVLGSLVQKNFGFVQFDSEEVANKCASALNKSTFKSNILTVRNASVKPKPNLKKNATKMNKVMTASSQAAAAAAAAAASAMINDCEIIVVNRANTKYAEFIEQRLTQAGLQVDLLYPNEDVMLGKVLSNISSRGCLYAVMVTPQHEELRSITVNILYGVPAEHRNMPVEDAITLIATNFGLKKQHDAVIAQNQIKASQTNRLSHPEPLHHFIEMLAEGHPLTAYQYETIIKYLQDLYAKQLKVEVGEAEAKAKLQAPDPEIEMQKKILNIMKGPSVTEIEYELMYPTFEEAKSDSRLMELLRDTRIMSAIKSVYNSEVLNSVMGYL